ncbi:hypothetical protein ORJ66_21145 [Pseudoalteromonas tunicata]|uniref:hypothetical protein n=1 Tax=Pseudoalteromonas tunicata TaxID=314281 RepID=UPI00273F5D8E|nr:hypothetical protein [Pseudoalteromonas tunicata]MDP5215554.1 hypothetical protein [Pseudoalteromonas tunicata]
MRILVYVFLTVFSVQIYATKLLEELSVSFFTIAANTEKLDQQKISIVGWIRFIEYKDKNVIRLFHSKSSLEEFRLEESILIKLPESDFEAAKGYLNSKLVTVYGKYSAPQNVGSLGELIDVRDIDIKTF